VSSEITDPDTNLRPGDILNKAGFHVVTVYQYTPGHINVRDSTIIEAAGAYYLYNRTEFYEPDKVWKRYPSNLKKEYLDRGYSPRRLVSY
ncbi:MAG: hypothetical protein NC906_06195, partial [Candidatus Omnitrophica bacterium]|nr:hypothetical protein [Candidatus Omnitrophota bacterium]